MTGSVRPLVIWLASVAGMALGFSIDCRSVSPAAIASLCAPGDSLAVLIRHLAVLPATNLAMAAGMLAAIAPAVPMSGRAACRSLACYALMLAGMSFGGCIGIVIAGEANLDWGAPLMLAGMTLGMTAAMMVAEPLSRLRENDQPAFRYRRW
jgi:hypothetical protein